MNVKSPSFRAYAFVIPSSFVLRDSSFATKGHRSGDLRAGWWVLCCLIALLPAAVYGRANEGEPSARSRVVVLTDISNEPDDEMSLVRFLVYANEFEVEGLIATTSVWLRDKLRADLILQTVKAFGEVQPNLARHAPGFPPAEQLLKVIAAGPPTFGMRGLGEGKLSSGTERLIAAADRDDPRPLWVTIWGGANTLAEALMHVRKTRRPEAVRTFVAKLRVYAISDQDDAGPWLRREFPDLFYVVSPSTVDSKEYHRATWTGISGDRRYRNCLGANFTTVSQEWLDEHIRGKGPLGKLYPKVKFIMEGDTPSFLNLIGNGLAAHESPGWGGWGGRYELRQCYGETRPIWTNSRDTVIGVDGKEYTSDQATIWRWRQAFQHDFAARMDWCLNRPKDANHNPVVVVNGEAGRSVVRIKASAGVAVKLSAAGTTDPGGHKLGYHWFVYPEAGTFRGRVEVAGASLEKTTVTLSDGAKGTAHVILAVENDGKPSLTAYRRVIVEVDDGKVKRRK
jgi:hypothetical protein